MDVVNQERRKRNINVFYVDMWCPFTIFTPQPWCCKPEILMHLLSSGKELGTTMVLSTKALTLDQGVQCPPKAQRIQRSHGWIYMKIQVQEAWGPKHPSWTLVSNSRLDPILKINFSNYTLVIFSWMGAPRFGGKVMPHQYRPYLGLKPLCKLLESQIMLCTNWIAPLILDPSVNPP